MACKFSAASVHDHHHHRPHNKLNPLVSGGKGTTLLNFNTTIDVVAASCFFYKKNKNAACCLISSSSVNTIIEALLAGPGARTSFSRSTSQRFAGDTHDVVPMIHPRSSHADWDGQRSLRVHLA